MKRLLVLPVLLALLVALPGAAWAESATTVAEALRSAPVYQSPGLDLVDVDALTGELNGSDPQVDVAVLPAGAATSAAQARSRAEAVVTALGDPEVVVLVVTASKHLGAAAGSGAARRGVDAGAALTAELAQNHAAFDKDAVTAFATSFAQRIADQASGDGAQGGSTADTGGDTVLTPSGGNGTLPQAPAAPSQTDYSGPLLVGGLGAAAVVALLVRSRSRKAKLGEALRADVVQLHDRLGSDVSTLDAGDDPVAKQALADAAERYNATGAALATADSPGEYAAARRSAIEGLTAAQTARRQLGLDPGPELPSLQGSGPHLAGEETVRIGDQDYEGSPTYRPGRGHYFEGGNVGGRMVHGGWYSAPFWTPFLLGSVLTGGFGGFGGGFGGDGFERGYDAGRADGSQDGGSSGGGDWGGGGFDSGGGDWGGGGMDSGGGGGDW